MMKRSLAIAALSLALVALIPTVRAQTAFTENFTGTSTTNSWFFLNGACLTMGTPTTTTAGSPACKGLPYYTTKGDPLKGGNTGTLPDTTSGALRFTGNYNENGAILSNFNYPLGTTGLAVSFTTVTYDGDSGGAGGDGADGISFFLQDATYAADVGAFGGSLGYTCSNSNNDSTLRPVTYIPRGYDGLSGGYIGLGIDEYGNFLNPGDNTHSGPNYTPNRIGIRGAGNISWSSLNAAYPTQYPSSLTNAQKASAVQYACSTGTFQDWSHAPTVTSFTPPATPLPPQDYAYVNGASKVLPSNQKIANEAATGGTTRGTAIPITYNLKIVPAGTVALPQALLSLSYSYNGGAAQNVIANQDITNGGTIPIPSNVRFGFAGSTGGSTNIHEIMCFQATPTNVSQSSAGLNQKQTAKVQVGTQVYFAFYNPTTLAGSLTSQYLDQDANNLNNLTIDPKINWDGSCNLTGAAAGACDSPNGPSGAIAVQAWNTGRTILTWNPTSKQGSPFEWANLTAAQQSALDSGDGAVTNPASIYPPTPSSRLNYLRGYRNDEQTPLTATTFAGAFRTRASVLGDIVDSSPTWVGPPTSPYPATWVDVHTAGDTFPENSGTTYATFAGSGTGGFLTRTNVVYAGANDGMLHGFRSGNYDSTNTYQKANNDGQEVLAYVPDYIVSTIQSATSTGAPNVASNYSDPQYGHHFDVDAPPGTGDLFYSGNWHTWLVGGLGQGGSAIYALDITDPSTFSEGNIHLVIGEWNHSTKTTTTNGVTTTTDTSTLTCTNVTTCASYLGKTYGVPQIRRFHNGQWGAVFGNGYQNSTGDAGIFIMLVDSTGTPTFRYLTTGWGSIGSPNTTAPNGIYFATPADLDGDHIVDYIYAGDLQGNVWRFDVTDKSDSNWKVVSNPIYSTSPAQPITTKVIVASVGPSPNPHILIEFGTGQQIPITNSRAATYSTTQQTLYGVWDWNLATWNSSSSAQYASLSSSSQQQGVTNLIQQSIGVTTTATSPNTGTDYRTVSSLPVCYADSTGCSSFGWYLNLVHGNAYTPDPAVPQNGNAAYANNPVVYEQVIFSPVLQAGSFIVNTTIPPASSPTMCFNSGASGWTMAINPATGGAFTNSFFGDVNHNFLNTVDSSGNTVAVSGIALGGTGSASIVVAGTQDYLITQTVSGVGAIESVNPPGGTKGSRLTWIERR